MNDEIQITFRDFPHSDAIEARIRERAAKLDELFGKITSCRVVIEEPHRRHQNGRKFRCRIDLLVPNAELVAENAEESAAREDPYAAVDEAFGEIVRQLEDYARRSRWDVKQHGGTPHGRVAKLMLEHAPGERYGFIETHDGREIYFHENSVLHHNFHKLEIGTEVRFAEEDGDKGPQASTVAVTKRQSHVTTTLADADSVPESQP
ncbi:MAG: hypothetical protein JWP97_1117 [Labilithrix sp.]|nr:hypothetical protein [Labilithrix sp.]